MVDTHTRARLPRATAALALALALAASSAAAETYTLDQAIELAERTNPALQSAQAALRAAEGEKTESDAPLRNNPELSGEHRWRTTPVPGLADEKVREWQLGIAQTFEIAGQQGYRRQAAEAALAEAKENVEAVRRRILAEVEQRFFKLLALQERLALEQRSLELIENAARLTQRRVAAGEDSRLAGNLARVEAERARNQIAMLEEQLIDARSELAATLQLPQGVAPQAVGDLSTPPPAYTLRELLDAATQRPDLRVLGHRERAARGRLSLERASVYPDITVGLFTERESSNTSRERINGLSLSIPLPLFRRNEAGIGRATTELTQVEIERRRALRDARAEVSALWSKLQSLRTRVDRLAGSVLPSLDENQRLSAKAYEAGEIGLVELLLVNRQTLDARRELLEAEAELRLVQAELARAAGIPSLSGR